MCAFSRGWSGLIIIALALVVSGCLLESSADPDPHRYAEDIATFAALDAAEHLDNEPIVFVGSSSIRGWKVAEQFPGLPILNRGFGGSQISDINYFIEQTVLQYSPRLVVFYAGENDIAGGKSSDKVAQDYEYFLEAVSNRFVDAEVIFISIKPTPKRWRDWKDMQAANQLIQQISAKDERYHYLDVSAEMLDNTGKPRASIYRADGIHMTEEGYDIWTRFVAPLIEEIVGDQRLEAENAG